jgi:hypothetical protein
MVIEATIHAMKQQTAFALACGITACLLVGGSAVVTNWRNQSTPTATIAAVSTDAPTEVPNQERAVFLAREAVYQHRLAEANLRIAQANATAVAATSTPAPEPNSTIAVNAPSAQAPHISMAQAERIASSAAMQHSADARTQRAELVSFQGVTAYEIILSNGVVYVDATSGAVLFNQWTPVPPSDQLVAAAPQNELPPPQSEQPPPQPLPPAPIEAPAPVPVDEQDEQDEHQEVKVIDEHEESEHNDD